MKTSVRAFLASACGIASLLTAVPVFAEEGKGGLVIVGGALRASNTAVYERFVELAGGVETARIGVIPAASGKPFRNARKFLDDMVAQGIPEERLTLLPIAVKDDSKTEDVDESSWSKNGGDPEVAAEIAGLTALWMIGGDQMRLRATLLDAEGAPLPAAKAMHKVLENGGVIGGTSAGAAIMSEIMIASGDSLGALSEGFTEEYGSMDEQEYGPVFLDRGLGLFAHGILDQHFDRKARFGRLITTTYAHRDRYPLGFGIEEDTALVISGDEAEVLGAGGVHVIDVTSAKKRPSGGYSNVRLSYFQAGDGWKFGEGYVNRSEKYGTVGGDEYFDTPDPINSGVFSRNALVKHLIGYDLVDNKATSEVRSYLFNPLSGDKGFELTFSQDDATKGYWKALDGQADSYAYTDVRLDVAPIIIRVEPLTE